MTRVFTINDSITVPKPPIKRAQTRKRNTMKKQIEKHKKIKLDYMHLREDAFKDRGGKCGY
jgi:hypothetical protein